jgi:pimeloyl-ACP methyl ester carboxylesterase
MSGRLMQLASGGSIGITNLGDPGAPHTVLLCHPTPGASGFDPDPTVTNDRDTLIIGADRPGYASSDPQDPQRCPPHLAELALLDEFSERGARIDAVIGWGYGGLMALRLAAERPERVRRVALVQTPAPGNRLYGLLVRRARVWSLQHHDPHLALAAEQGGTRIRALSLLGAAPEEEALALPGLRERCERMLDQSVLRGEAGIAFDRTAGRRHDWGRLARGIRADVLVLNGERDRRLSVADARWFARRLPHVEVQLVREAGPLAIASEWGRVLDFALR